jgi:acyl-CoA reductase-like NAD-dependent aldehyde dehydrogenase
MRVTAALLVIVAAAVAAGEAQGQAAPVKRSEPAWSQLSPEQREALSPLAGDWEKFDAPRKKKWLDIAARYKDLSPEGKQRMHERMPDLAKLTPEQRTTARENFKRAYALPPDQRRALTQQFQDLPEEKKRELAEQSRKKPGAPPRRGAGHPAARKDASPPPER